MTKLKTEATLKVSLECDDFINKVNRITKIPKKYVVELAVKEYYENHFGKEKK